MIGPFGKQGPAATFQAALSSNDSKTLYEIYLVLSYTNESKQLTHVKPSEFIPFANMSPKSDG